MKRKENVIAIMSPKGGVGKTVTTANLAVALALIHDKKVLAVDTNISTASLGMHFDIFYPEHTINDVTGKNGDDKKTIHIYHQNLHILPASIKVRKESSNPKEIQKNLFYLTKKYERFLSRVSGDYDIVLLDCSPGFDLETLAALHLAGGMIIVTNPDYPSIATTTRAVEYAKKINVPVGGLVLNKVRNKKYELSKENIRDILEMEILQVIPHDKHIPISISNRKPVVLNKRYSKSGKAFQKLAADIIGEDYEGNWTDKIKNKLKIS